MGGGGTLLTYFLLRDKDTQAVHTSAPRPVPMNALQAKVEPPLNPPARGNPPIQGQPVVQPAKPEPKQDFKPPAVVEEAPPHPPQASDGRLGATVLERVKRATVYLRVTMADGSQSIGHWILRLQGIAQPPPDQRPCRRHAVAR